MTLCTPTDTQKIPNKNTPKIKAKHKRKQKTSNKNEKK